MGEKRFLRDKATNNYRAKRQGLLALPFLLVSTGNPHLCLLCLMRGFRCYCAIFVHFKISKTVMKPSSYACLPVVSMRRSKRLVQCCRRQSLSKTVKPAEPRGSSAGSTDQDGEGLRETGQWRLESTLRKDGLTPGSDRASLRLTVHRRVRYRLPSYCVERIGRS